MPQPVVATLQEEFDRLLKLAEGMGLYRLQGVESRGGTPAEFADFIHQQSRRWGKVVRESPIRAE